MTALPIDPVLPKLMDALASSGRAVLQAPPGAGKTTRVPLAMLDAGLTTGKIIMLEPRRLAARAAAERLAEGLGETPGQTVGYRMRGDSKAGSRIEVVTEGILTRMIQSDPELTGIGAVIFDEFHERSLNADLGLALAWESRSVLRPDLLIFVMSATLDAAPVAAMLDDAPVITSEGRSFPVTTRFLDRAVPKTQRLEDATADLVASAVAETQGGILVFLPGEGEIRRTAALLAGRLPAGCTIRPLYGALPFAEQRKAIAPLKEGRKIVLSTSIAETSLTIEDIRVVVDAGRARRARFDPSSGMSRLVTEKVSKAEATQRAGRAGRVAPGDAYCLWTKGEHGALPAFAPAEIEAADLAGLALEMAVWGSDDLAFLTPPPPGALAEARTLLHGLGALDSAFRITPHGRALAALPLHPRLAHILQIAGKAAAPLAALLAARDPLRGAPVDLALRIAALKGRYDGPGTAHPVALAQIKSEIPRLTKGLPDKAPLSLGQQAALAYPDRIGLRRKGDDPRYVLSGGKGAVLDAADPIAGARLIVATDLDGDTREARIRQAVTLTERELRDLFADQIAWADICEWSKRDRKVLTRQQERFGALALDDRQWSDAPDEAIAQAMLEGVRQLGLRPSPAADRFRARVALVDDLPAMDDATLLDTLEDWLLPHVTGVRSAEDWKRFDILPALRAMLDWDQMQRLDRAAPAHFETPLGRKIPIDYDGDAPGITLRLQEMFGVTTHPMVGRTPLRVTLLSPGQKPVQVTQDIVGFWASSYADVRRDMRGRYPRHPWPEDPTQADPTLRAKPRGT
ncbi:ATP-dependent helicase HrpB [Loktanella sp. PT4BL]|jgi:ATP-dependent helicase HrpB|uniref:ATP-dependent helicase HrpB n=1 Tax=Loktanella sp. PT4BL TaxID=2135611 RepID=UPI000D754298|nr:ATP-dependent helicase HrpB [Loktanella sp. PT4BL]PXW72819.1 ATP-dependent helicase HrpB [Loktanella sp. PT4BL]